MAEETGVIPPSLANRPELDPSLEEYWSAFITLSNARRSGFNGEERIAMTEIDAYLRIFPDDDPERFVRLIQVMDSAFMKHREAEKAKKPTPIARR